MPEQRTRRPALMSIRPLWLRERLAYRLYLARAHEWPALFSDVPLAFAPGVRLDLLPTDVGHAVVALAGFYELAVSRRIARLARGGGTLVDVGANYGYYTCLWAAAHLSNRVIAVEASPRNIAPLRANITRNECDSRVTVLPIAAGAAEGTAAFEPGVEDQSGWGGLAASSASTPSGGSLGEASVIEVPSRRLDDIVTEAGWPRVDVLKVDVEGADALVLQGAERLLAEGRVGMVFFEQNVTRMRALGIGDDEPFTVLRRHGYRMKRIAAGEWMAWRREGK